MKIHFLARYMVAAAMICGIACDANAQATDPFDQIPDGGSGWADDWGLSAGASGVGIATLGLAANELSSGSGSHVILENTGAVGGQIAYSRDYSAGISTNLEHLISFQVRPDAYNDGGVAGDPTRSIVAFGGASISGLSSNATWAFYTQDGTFRVFDGDGTGGFGGAVFDTGVAFDSSGASSPTTHDLGDTFEVTIINRIGADNSGATTLGEYDISVENLTDSTTVLSLTDLDYRDTAGTAGTFLNLGLRGQHTTSYDQVSAAPEPSSLLCLGMAFAAIACRRKA